MQDHGRLTAVHISRHSPSHNVETFSRSRSVARRAHIRAFTFSSQDLGRLDVVHESKHSLFSWCWNSQLCCVLCCLVLCVGWLLVCLVGWLVGLRVVLQKLKQDDVEVVASRLESKHVDTCKTNAQIWAKRTTATHRTKRTKSGSPKIQREDLSPSRFQLIPKNSNRIELQSLQI